MSTLIYCAKLKKELESLDKPPFPGALGEKIYQQVSKDAWRMWLSHKTILINEYRLNLLDKEAKKFLQNELEKFFFEDEIN